MITIVLLASTLISAATGPLPPDVRDRLLAGSHVVVDPSFPYYKGRSWRGIAKEIRATGVSTVTVLQYHATPEILAAFREEGLAVCGSLWGTIIYGSHSLDPPPPERALQVHISGPRPRGTEPLFYCPRHPEYREWYRDFAQKMLSGLTPDAVVIGESFYGAWPGLSSPTASCFCDLCLAELAHRLGREEPIELGTPEKRRAFLEDELAFQEWVDMRVEAWLEFMVTAYEAAKETLPDAPVGAILLAIDEPDGPRRVREANGQDPGALLEKAPYDFVSFQAHWPDWMKPDLSPEHHARSYKSYVRSLPALSPSLPIGIVPDIGSNEDCRRGSAWVRRLRVAARGVGFTFVEPYEYSVGGSIYEDPPQVIEYRRLSPSECELVFSKRVEGGSAKNPGNYRLEGGEHSEEVRFDGGNIVTLRFADNLPEGRRSLLIEGVRDDPSTFWFNGGKAQLEWKYPGHSVPAGHMVTW